MSVIEELEGVVALPCYMDDSLNGFAHRIATCIREEQCGPYPNNALIALLCDAGRLAWEQAQHPRISIVQQDVRAAGVREGLKRAAKALCSDCSMGRPVHRNEDGLWKHDYDDGHHGCEAWAIQALIEADGEGA